MTSLKDDNDVALMRAQVGVALIALEQRHEESLRHLPDIKGHFTRWAAKDGIRHVEKTMDRLRRFDEAVAVCVEADDRQGLGKVLQQENPLADWDAEKTQRFLMAAAGVDEKASRLKRALFGPGGAR